MRALLVQIGEGIENTRQFQRGVFREIARLQLGFDEGGSAQQENERIRARLVELFRRGQKRGDLARAHDPDRLAAAFVNLTNGTITDWLFEEQAAPLQERMRAVAEVFLGSVGEEAEAAGATPLPDLNPAPLWSPES